MMRETFDELLTSVEQGGTILRGKKAPNRSFRIDNPNVLAIRRHLGLTQQKFAGLLGISPATLPGKPFRVSLDETMGPTKERNPDWLSPIGIFSSGGWNF